MEGGTYRLLEEVRSYKAERESWEDIAEAEGSINAVTLHLVALESMVNNP